MEVKFVINIVVLIFSCLNAETLEISKVQDDYNQKSEPTRIDNNDHIIEKLGTKLEETKFKIPPIYTKNEYPLHLITKSNGPITFSNVTKQRDGREKNLEILPKVRKLKPRNEQTKPVEKASPIKNPNSKQKVISLKVLPVKKETLTKHKMNQSKTDIRNPNQKGDGNSLKPHATDDMHIIYDHDFHEEEEEEKTTVKIKSKNGHNETYHKSEQTTFYEEDHNEKANNDSVPIVFEKNDAVIVETVTHLDDTSRESVIDKHSITPDVVQSTSNSKIITNINEPIVADHKESTNETSQDHKNGISTDSDGFKPAKDNSESVFEPIDMIREVTKDSFNVKTEQQEKSLEFTGSQLEDLTDAINDIIIKNDDVSEVIQRYRYPYETKNQMQLRLNDYNLGNIQGTAPVQKTMCPYCSYENVQNFPYYKYQGSPYVTRHLQTMQYVAPEKNYLYEYYTQIPVNKDSRSNYLNGPNYTPVYYNRNNFAFYKPDNSLKLPPFRYPFEEQFQDIVFDQDGRRNNPFYKNYITNTVEMNAPKSPYNYYNWKSTGTYQQQPSVYSGYDPVTNYNYQENVYPSNNVDKIWRSWRKTNIIIKDHINDAKLLQNGRNCRNCDGRRLNKPVSMFNQRKCVISGNGCY